MKKCGILRRSTHTLTPPAYFQAAQDPQPLGSTSLAADCMMWELTCNDQMMMMMMMMLERATASQQQQETVCRDDSDARRGACAAGQGAAGSRRWRRRCFAESVVFVVVDRGRYRFVKILILFPENIALIRLSTVPSRSFSMQSTSLSKFAFVSQIRHSTLVNNLTKCWHIFKILSPANS